MPMIRRILLPPCSPARARLARRRGRRAAPDAQVTIDNFTFSPAELTVAPARA